MCKTHELLLPQDESSPALARDFARTIHCVDNASEVMDDTLLLISEVVTNAVRYACSPIVLTIECAGTGVHVSVRDGALTLPQQRRSADGDESGRGLGLIEQLSHSWSICMGQDKHGLGKAVSFELRSPAEAVLTT